MSTLLDPDCAQAIETWPAEAREVLEEMRAVFPPVLQRRRLPRISYHREAHITLLGGSAFDVYTRDVNAWSVGFITQRQINTGERGELKLVAPDGTELEIACRVIRYRQLRPGWFDAGAEFAIPHEALADYQIQAYRPRSF